MSPASLHFSVCSSRIPGTQLLYSPNISGQEKLRLISARPTFCLLAIISHTRYPGHVFFLLLPVVYPNVWGARRYKSEGRGFDYRWCHWNLSLWPHCGPGVDSATNRNEYQEYILGGKGGRCVGLRTLPPSCTDFLEIWEPQPPGTLRASSGL